MRGEDRAPGEARAVPVPATYHDRSRSPGETVALMAPHFAALGITRVARQTGLDRVGIACFAAFRPNSRSIACNQGKGVDDDCARASAVMEAVEYAVAEAPDAPLLVAAANELGSERCVDPGRALPLGDTFDPGRRISWLSAYRLADREPVFVPRDLVVLDGVKGDLPGLCQHTNGLASGNTADEAIFHGACELIERDANTMWSLLDGPGRLARCLKPETLGDDLVLALIARFAAAGIAVRLFEQTTDLGIPTILAVTAPTDGVAVKHYDVAAGAGTHPHPARAALRAITEAAQTRITSIAAARDDVRPDSYRLDGSAEAAMLMAAEPVRAVEPVDRPLSSSADGLLRDLLATLRRHGVDDLVAVPLGGEAYGVSVVRVLSNLLEDRGPNANWVPGPRALGALFQ